MQSLRTYIAFLLLVLLVRVFAPEAAILSLHEHEHTEDALTANDLVSKAHVHCDVDDFYDSSYLDSDFSVALALIPQTSYYVAPYGFAWKFTYPNNTYLRGPPQA